MQARQSEQPWVGTHTHTLMLSTGVNNCHFLHGSQERESRLYLLWRAISNPIRSLLVYRNFHWSIS